MRLEIENIGKLTKADVELKGITVIAGENNTGKSTVGKALYCMFNSFYDVQSRMETERKNSVMRILNNLKYSFKNFTPIVPRFTPLINDIFDDNRLSYSVEDIVTKISSFFVEQSDNEISFDDDESLAIEEAAKRIIEIFAISKDQLFSNMLNRSFELEFCGQVCNLFSNDESGRVDLTIKSNTVSAAFKRNRVSNIDDLIELETEAIYIDDPLVLDNLSDWVLYNHRYNLPHRTNVISRLKFGNRHVNMFDEIIVNNKLKNIYEKINYVCEGNLERDSNSYFYHIPNVSESIDIYNVSTGLKTFVLIKTLLQKGEIGERSTMILDEPEIHLHPEWQLIFAEIIVLLQKEFDMTILINTHSPYFFEAIEVYSQKHGIESKCKYYLAENSENVSTLKDVTQKPESIYKKLAEPFQKLENERYCDE